MSRVVKRSASQAVKAGRSRRDASLPQFVPFQLSQSVERPPSGAQWVHEIKLDGYRMAARIDNGRVKLLTRTGLDWTAKYPCAVEALSNLSAKSAYLDRRTLRRELRSSPPGGELMHLKGYCVDHRLLRTGSANFSRSGETRQDNDLLALRCVSVRAGFDAKFGRARARS
jgi:phosphatidylserine/phosphatidylglycerophosphate/cardiolipin synthase-like enzyme